MALSLALLCSSYSNSQTTDSTTGNLINTGSTPTDTTSIWNNGVYVNQLCFQAGQPGNCGPNPSVRPGGIINYSYGTVDLNQIVNINAGLASVGSNIQLSGFNFGFMAKNGNGWDDARQDYLSAYVKLYGSSGNQVANYDYTSQTNQKYNWTQFNFSETFATPYTTSSLSTARVGFIGRDNNFWAGNYGPEIYNVSFSLKYSVKPDPCIADPLSSPTCPGYALATVKNSILGSTVSNASATSFVPATNYTSPAPAAAPPGVADAAPALAQASPQQQAQQPAPQQGPAPAPAPGQDPNQNPSAAQDNPAQPSPQQQGPAPTQAQPAGGPPQATQTANAPPPSAGPQQAGPQQGGGSGPSKLAMSVVKSAQAKEQAMQQTAVQNAAKAFENTQQSSQAASNAAVSMNQDMSANSATAAANFASQATQASTQVATQASQSTQQTQQASSQQQQQSNKSVQLTQQTQEVQQAQQQQTSSSLVQLQPPQQVVQQVETQSAVTAKVQTPQVQETQQSQTQTTASVVQVQQPVYTPPPQQETQSTSVVMLKPPTPLAAETQSQAGSGTGLTASRNTFAYNPLSAISSSNISAASTQTTPVYQPRLQERIIEVDAPQMQVASFSGLGRAGNPLSEMMMQQRFEMMQENIQQQTSTVNRNVQPNDLAGGIDLTAMASVPQGFNAYSFMMKDAAFYEPKEVYKNQKTVDNERVLRGLTRGSDRLHQEMIDQQYK